MNEPYFHTTLLHRHGMGDALQAESFWCQEERHALRRIVQCAPSSKSFLPLIEANPEFSQCENVVWRPPADLPHAHEPTTYWSQGILHRRTFTGSSFLRHTLAPMPDLPIPDRYFVVHATTPFNERGHRAYRDMRPPEWQPVLDRLESRDQVAVVLNSEPESIPDHPRLVDLTGKTSMPESIEILKHAEGYYGIDSCFAILAAQLFDPEDLWVRTKNHRVVSLRHTYYPPQEDFSFLVPDFFSPPYPKGERLIIDKNMKFIRTLGPLMIGSHNYDQGDVVEVEEGVAKRLIDSRHAEAFDPTTIPQPKVYETATRLAPRKAARLVGKAG